MTQPRFIVCPLPGMGDCIRERCVFWEEAGQECGCDCLETGGPAESGSGFDPEFPCQVAYSEDYD
jgi:hypothetical protein